MARKAVEMSDEYFAADPPGLIRAGTTLDDSAQKFLALEEETLNAAGSAQGATGNVAPELGSALSYFGQLWAIQARVVAIRAAALAREVKSIATTISEQDKAGATAMGSSVP